MKFSILLVECERRGLILEKVRVQYDQVIYRYEITNNRTGVTSVFSTLTEAWSELCLLD